MKKPISKTKPAAKSAKIKGSLPIKTKARPIAQTAHKKVKPEPKKPEAKKVPVKPVKVVAKPAPKLPTKVTAKEPVKPQQSPLVKRSEEVKKTVSKPEPVRAVLGKESLKVPGKIDPKAKKNGAAGPDAAQPGTPPKEESDAPLLDLSDAAVRKMITRAKQRGYVTYDELNRVLPSDKVSSEQIEDTMAMLNEMGINVIES